LSIEGMVGACGLPKERFCTACFNDEYPIAIPQQLQLDKLKFEDPSSRAGVKNGIDLKPDMTRVFDT
jgi:amidophosphoribosyltransferase